MPSIESLAPETLLRILELSREPSATYVKRCDALQDPVALGTLQESYHTECLKTLSAASLVAKSWRGPAQALMWRRVFLRTRPERQLSCPIVGHFRTPICFIVVKKFEPSITKVLDKLDGIKVLVLSAELRKTAPRPDPVQNAAWMSSDKLADLTELFLDVPLLETSRVNVQFKLKSLSLGQFTNSPNAILSIFEASSETLRHVSLRFVPPALTSTILHFLPRLGPTLTSLRLVDLIPGIEKALASFTVLETLSISIRLRTDLPQVDAILAAFASPIANFTLYKFPEPGMHFLFGIDAFTMRDLLDRLERKEWKGLKEIAFELSDITALKALPTPVEVQLTKRCAERGINLRFWAEVL